MQCYRKQYTSILQLRPQINNRISKKKWLLIDTIKINTQDQETELRSVRFKKIENGIGTPVRELMISDHYGTAKTRGIQRFNLYMSGLNKLDEKKICFHNRLLVVKLIEERLYCHLKHRMHKVRSNFG